MNNERGYGRMSWGRAYVVGEPKLDCFAMCLSASGGYRCNALSGDVMCEGCAFYKSDSQHRRDTAAAKKKSALKANQYAQEL